jgi:hypothetical protein
VGERRSGFKREAAQPLSPIRVTSTSGGLAATPLGARVRARMRDRCARSHDGASFSQRGDAKPGGTSRHGYCLEPGRRGEGFAAVVLAG